MANFNVYDRTIENLLSWIDEGRIAIPEIQRPFVWKKSKVRDLIDSLYKNYPIGYIITWRNPDTRLKDGTLAEGKEILIDGQQRVTALMAAIAGKKVINKRYEETQIKIAFNPLEEKFDTHNPSYDNDDRWISDIREILDNDFSFFEFIPKYNELTGYQKTDKELEKILQKIKGIKSCKVGVIELASELDIDQVTEIFIRINSQGVPLSQSDFAMSKISVNENYQGPLIRKTIDYFSSIIKSPNAIKDIQENDTFFAESSNFNKIKWADKYVGNIVYDPEYTDILRVSFTYKFNRGKLSDLVSLLSGRDFEKRTFEEAITEDTFTKLHEAILNFTNQTNFERFLALVKGVGIIEPNQIRSKNALNFAYALYLLLREKGVNEYIINKAVKRWLVSSILTGRYSSSTETRFEEDIRRFVNAEDPLVVISRMEEGELSDAYWHTILPDRFETSVRTTYWSIYLMAQNYLNDKAFLSKSAAVKNLIEGRGDIHHLFPKKYLQSKGIKSKGKYNQIANFVYTEQRVNLTISKIAPKDYMTQVLEQVRQNTLDIGEIDNEEELLENLKMNCIPEEIFEGTVENYEEFLARRRVLMAEKVKQFYFSI
jgi:hypothetical protein